MKKIYLSLIVILVAFSIISWGCGDSGQFGKSYDKEKIHHNITAGNTGFAFDIFKQLNSEDKEKNIFISPFSISTALTMTYQGAAGSTQEAMADTLGFEGVDMQALNETYKNLLGYLQQADEKVELRISNSIWIREGEDIKEEFITTNRDTFDAAVSELDFSREEAADEINSWIDESTKGKISKMIEPPIDPRVVMYLINAIYFKGEWTEQFDKKNTFSTEFTAGSGKKTDIMMMSKKGETAYGRGEDFQAVKLPYGKEKISMYLVLPEIPINDFIQELDGEKWRSIKKSISERDDVLVQIPRFKLEYGIKELKESLSVLGMEVAFTDGADFSGIRNGLYISSVLHKAVIEVNEEGSEAAAATVVEMQETAAVEPVRFIADRPFIFIIEDSEFGTVLFMGKVYDLS